MNEKKEALKIRKQSREMEEIFEREWRKTTVRMEKVELINI